MREPAADLSNPNSWPLGPVVAEQPFATDDAGCRRRSRSNWIAGPYRVLLDTKDAFGKAVTAVLPVQVLDPQADRLATKVPFVCASRNGSWNQTRRSWPCGELAMKQAEPTWKSNIAARWCRATGLRARTHTVRDRTGSHRSDARRVHRSRDHGARESGVSGIAATSKYPGPTNSCR